jgi:soluble lytic murein transglycosylase-like protein
VARARGSSWLAPARRRRRRSRWRALVFVVLLLGLGLAAWRWRRELLGATVEQVRYRSHIQRVESHAEVIRAAALEARIDPNLLAAIMLSESGGRVDAVSRVDALGLFQLMLPTAQERARVLRLPEPTREELLSDPLLNARLAASYLRWLDRRYDGHLEPMLIAYNAGPGRLGRWIREAGSYDAWRAEREAAGNSDVLRYAAKVIRFRGVFAERGVIAPQIDRPPAPAGADEPPAALYGPPPAQAHEDASPLAPDDAP